VVSVAEITDTTDFNLSVRPYTDQGLPAEMPADAAAIISGGVPRREVEAVADRFAAFGIDPITLFFPANPRPSLTDASGRLYFYEEGYEATAAEIGDLTAPREDEFAARCQAWWDGSQSKFTELAGERKLLSSRPQLIEDFASKLISNGLLGEYQLRGAFAAWWSAWRDDLQVLEHYGFQAVLDQWLASGRPRARTIRGDPSDIVLDLLGTDLAARTQALVVTERQKLVDTYLWWGERYGTSLLQLEAEAQEARGKLEDRFRELGYMDF
jgi:type I restriction enzyme M protein